MQWLSRETARWAGRSSVGIRRTISYWHKSIRQTTLDTATGARRDGLSPPLVDGADPSFCVKNDRRNGDNTSDFSVPSHGERPVTVPVNPTQRSALHLECCIGQSGLNARVPTLTVIYQIPLYLLTAQAARQTSVQSHPLRVAVMVCAEGLPHAHTDQKPSILYTTDPCAIALVETGGIAC
jgi:hypothetical protein